MSDLTHTPVLLQETIDHLNLRAGQTVVDCTLGLGGHSEAILEKIGSKGHLIAFDQDEDNLKVAKSKLETLNSKIKAKITYIHDNFEYLEEHLKERGIKTVNAIFFDLGLSSPHVDDPERGFSFMKDGPLDMRYDKRQGLTAEKVVNTYNEEKLAYIIFKYGEERRSRIIAKKNSACEKNETDNEHTSTRPRYRKHSRRSQIKNPSRHPDLSGVKDLCEQGNGGAGESSRSSRKNT